MCGRIALYADSGQVAELFDIDSDYVPAVPPSWNIAPKSPVIACYRRTKMATVPWGIQTRNGERPLINARSETAHAKPTFAKAFDKARCLIPVNGFYEWTPNQSGRKRPVWITRQDDQPFALAGLIVLKPTPALVIMTTEPNSLVRPIHNRMPVIVQPESFDDWFTQEARSPQMRAITASRPWEAMQALPVSHLVNSPRHDGPELIAAA